MIFRLILALFVVLVASQPGLAFNYNLWRPFSGYQQSQTQSQAQVPIIQIANYHVGIGIVPTFSSVSNSVAINNIDVNFSDDLGFSKDVTLFDVTGQVRAGRLNVNGYYLIPKTINGTGLLPAAVKANVKDKDKTLAGSSSWTLNAGRLEFGIPINVNNAFMIEPQFVWQWINPRLDIAGQDYTFSKSAKLSQGGIGIEATETITSYSSFKAKYLATSDSSLFQLKYLLNQNIGSLATGWNWWKFDIDRVTTRMSGPFVEVRVGF